MPMPMTMLMEQPEPCASAQQRTRPPLPIWQRVEVAAIVTDPVQRPQTPRVQDSYIRPVAAYQQLLPVSRPAEGKGAEWQLRRASLEGRATAKAETTQQALAAVIHAEHSRR